VDGEVEADRGFKLLSAAVGSAPDLFFGESCEPTLDLIDPGRVGGGEMDLETGMTDKLAADQRRLVSARVVDDEMDTEVAWDLAFNVVEKAAELDRTMPAVKFSDHLAAGDIESGEE
jgi:hypothetical protein